MEQMAPTQTQPEACDSGFDVPEELLARQLGLSRTEIRKNRGARGPDWEFVGNRICWSENAAARLVDSLGPKPPPPDASVAKNPASEPPALNGTPILPKAEVLEVIAWNFPNPRVIRAANGHGPIIVRVKNARLFRTGMKILARPDPAGGLAWQFEGNPERPEAGIRYPRRPGVW